MNILFLDKSTAEFLELYRNKFRKTKKYYSASEIEVIYTHFHTISWDRFPNLKVVLCPCTGIEHLGEFPKGIEVIHLDDRDFLYNNVFSTANWTMFNIMKLLRFHDDELTNKLVGIVGVGRIGQQLAPILMSHKAHIISYDKYKAPFGYNPTPDLGELLEKSDIVTIHIEENKDTKNLINNILIENYLKDKAYFLNCSRSSIVDGRALLDRYYDSKLSGIAIDVYEGYPDVIKSAFFELSQDTRHNVIVTDHIAGKGNVSRVATDEYIFRRFEEWVQK